jgi:excisionase family DNA binding protein
MRDVESQDQVVYTMAEAARLKGVSYHTISRVVRRGVVPCTRMGRQVLISQTALDAWEPMVERRPRKYPGRVPDPGVKPSVILPGSGEAIAAARSLERLVSVLGGLGERELPSATLAEIGSALAALLGCADAAIIEWLPGNEGFEVRAAVGAPRDWLSFQDAGPQVITRPIRIAGQSVGLFAGVPDGDRQPLTERDRDLALALLALAGVAIVWGRRG